MTNLNNKTWVTELSEGALIELKNAYRELLVGYEIYTAEEVETFVEDIENEKLANLEDAVGIELLEKLCNY